MICVDQNGQAVEISVADQMWLDDAYFKEKQLRLGKDAPRAALAYRVSTKGQVDHDDTPMQKIDCRKFAQKQGWRVVKEVAEKGVSGSKVSASKRDAIQQLKEEAANGEFDILLVRLCLRQPLFCFHSLCAMDFIICFRTMLIFSGGWTI